MSVINVTITTHELRKALAEVEKARTKGWTGTVAVLTLAKGGRSIWECVVVYEGLLAQSEDGEQDLGHQYHAEHLPTISGIPLRSDHAHTTCPKHGSKLIQGICIDCENE
jgi:hypothetical protein